MSISEKLITIAENQQRVYDAGFAAGQADSGESVWQYVYTMSETFKNAVFPANYELILTLPFVRSITYLVYQSTNLKKLTLRGGDSTYVVGGSYLFYHSELEEIDFSNFRNGGIKFSSSAKYPFRNCTQLRYIRGQIDMSSVTDTLHYFTSCGRLVEVRFKEGSIKVDLSIPSNNLSDDSIQSVVEGLADLTGAATQTLTLVSATGGKVTDAQKAQITAKNWTLVY